MEDFLNHNEDDDLDLQRDRLENALQKESQRAQDVLSRHGKEGAEEFLLRMVQRKIQEGKTTATIAEELGLNFSQVLTLRRKRNKILSRQVHALDTASLLGESIAFTNRIKEEAFKLLDDPLNKSYKVKVESLNTGLKAEEVLNKMLDKSGFFDAKPMVNRDQDDDFIKEGNLLGDLARSIMTGESIEEKQIQEDDDSHIDLI